MQQKGLDVVFVGWRAQDLPEERHRAQREDAQIANVTAFLADPGAAAAAKAGEVLSDGTHKAGFNEAKCLACHQPLDSSDYVFSIEALKEKASAAN